MVRPRGLARSCLVHDKPVVDSLAVRMWAACGLRLRRRPPATAQWRAVLLGALGCLLMASCSSAPVRHAAAAPSTASTSTRSRPNATSAPSSAVPSTSKRPDPRLTAAEVRWRLPRPLSRAVVLSDGNGLLVAGGLTLAGSTAGILRLDPATGAVRTAGRLAEAVHDAAGVSLGAVRLVFGGGDDLSTAVVQRFGLAGAGVVVGRLPRVRSDLVAAVVGSTGYVMAGYDGSRPDASVLATTDGRHFQDVGSLPLPVRYPAVASDGQDIYLFGGESAAGVSSVIQRLDPSTGSVRIVGRLPRPLAHCSAFALDGDIFVLGGISVGRASADIWRYDPATGLVELAGRLPYRVSDAASAVINGTAYLLGGEAPNPIATVVALHPR